MEAVGNLACAHDTFCAPHRSWGWWTKEGAGWSRPAPASNAGPNGWDWKQLGACGTECFSRTYAYSASPSSLQRKLSQIHLTWWNPATTTSWTHSCLSPQPWGTSFVEVGTARHLSHDPPSPAWSPELHLLGQLDTLDAARPLSYTMFGMYAYVTQPRDVDCNLLAAKWFWRPCPKLWIRES